MTNLDDPDDLPEVRETLRRAGYDVDAMSDEQAVEALKELLDQNVPRPAVKAGSRPIGARLWLSEAITSGGFRQPEDPDQLARLEDDGPPVPLAVLAMLVMRHTSGARPTGWDDAGLSEKLGLPEEHFTRAQMLVDEVAILVGRPATPEPRWWERA